jgi:hypothetical protein
MITSIFALESQVISKAQMPIEPFNSPGKQAVRVLWNTPLLRYLHTTFGVKYLYFGLPGSDMRDVILWRDMIEEVVAFEIPARGQNDRANIELLRRNMARYGISGRVYYGPFEEIVLLGQDFESSKYKQEKIITLYNLDFCDEITSMVATSSGQQLLRYEALRKILNDQKECFRQSGNPSYFIMLITIRNQFTLRKLEGYFAHNLNVHARQYFDRCVAQSPLIVEPFTLGKSWVLKTFIYNLLCQYFVGPHVSALFFPTVKYDGNPIRKGMPSPMIHFMVLCRFANQEMACPIVLPRAYLTGTTSIKALDRTTLLWEAEPFEPVKSGVAQDPEAWFHHNKGSILNDLPPIITEQ